MSATCKNIKTPNPAWLSLRVEVDEESLANLGGSLPVEGTLFGSALWKSIFPRDYFKLYQNFIYITQIDTTKAGVALLFGPPISEQEADTPFRVTTSTSKMYWDTVLRALIVVPDPGATRSQHRGSITSGLFRPQLSCVRGHGGGRTHPNSVHKGVLLLSTQVQHTTLPSPSSRNRAV